ncbi:MAG TPA: PHP domain-containing protein [Sneathiellales bacterium]|nr:PHP domain-containing protein [Sneathiellales bacterium]
MAHADFVHLRLHTAYSLSEGAIQVKALAPLCAKNRMPAVAVTDTGNLFGALEISELAASAGVQPIIGCTLAMRETRIDESELGAGPLDEPARIVLLVQDEQGYKNLLELSSRAYLETDSSDTPHVTLDQLRQ